MTLYISINSDNPFTFWIRSSKDCSNVSWDEGIKAELLNWNTELGKFSFVGLNHVRVSFSDLFQLCLNLTNRLVLQLLNFLKRAANHTESLGVDSSRCQNLVSLRIFRLESLLDRLKLLFEDEVAQARPAMYIVYNAMELVEKLLLLLLNVLKLLMAHLILPLNFLII